MAFRAAPVKSLAIMLSSLLLPAAGCSEAVLGTVLRELGVIEPAFPIVGTTDREVFFLARGAAQPTDEDTLAAAAHYDLYALDVTSLIAEPVLRNIATRADDLLAATTKVAWISRDDPAIIVEDRTTGERTRLFEGLEEPEARFELAALTDQTLVIHRGLGLSSSPVNDRYEYIVVDLASGEQARAGNAWYYNTFAFGGGFIAFMNDRDSDADLLGFELRTNLDLVNLATAERTTIAPDIRVSRSSGGIVLFDGGRFHWQEYISGSFQSRVLGYDVETGSVIEVAEPLERGGTGAQLWDVQGDQLLITVEEPEGFFGQQTSIELRGFDRSRKRIIRFESTTRRPWSFELDPRFVGNNVMWTDPYTGAFTIHDPATRLTRSFDPASIEGD
jgi:hypothetical protein